MEEAKVNVEEIKNLRKKLLHKKKNVVHPQLKLCTWRVKLEGKRKIVVFERNRVKLLGFVVLILWVFISLLSIVIAMNVGGHRRNWVVAEVVHFFG